MSWVEVVGPCGVGKTTLMRSLADVRVPRCETDFRDFAAAVDTEIQRWRGSDLVLKRLRMLRAVVDELPGTERPIENGPIAWLGAIAAREPSGAVVDRLVPLLPACWVLYLTASREALLERLIGRGSEGGTAQRHIDRVDDYIGIAQTLVRRGAGMFVTVDTTGSTPEKVAADARRGLEEMLGVPACR